MTDQEKVTELLEEIVLLDRKVCEGMSKAYHHWRWRSPKYLLTCNTSDGLIDVSGPEGSKRKITCKNCIRIMKARGWKNGQE